jgi:hypothetical protein
MENTLDLIYKVELLEDLVSSQEESLRLKNQLIDNLENELTLRKRQNIALCAIMLTCFIVFALMLSLCCIL